MRKLFILTIVFLTGLGNTTQAQQEAMYSQYMFNTLAVNPAYAGSRNLISATGLLRSQWTGIDGAPRTTTFTIDAPIEDKRMGVGVQIFSDKIGITSTTGAFASYAYRIRMDKASLSFGLQAGVSQYRADFSSVSLNYEGGSNDAAFQENTNKLMPNFGTGVYYNSDRFYIGLSAPQLLNNKFSGLKVEGDNSFAGKQAHFFLASGYVMPLGEDFSFKPSFLLKGVRGAPLAADFNGTLWIRNTIAFGAQYRTNAAFAGLLELQVTPQVRLGYAYDYTTTSLKSYSGGSHEIMLRYEFGFEKGKVLSPRYF
ncbi:type IX secretion system membrane protein PorP/SprF [Pedobacter sp. SYSU D00535]|uniref:PorP/SprF family type IX secretion system membrane protein n=1 Tax=Pedobacter sp. SYSU D00535 TaxID=2810308 RepID=UPI001A96B81B|nr:type IX secretion system membrane protein PorP/SprF [Pedobacter sp. SYSU D00535]